MHWLRHVSDPDALVESVLSRVGLDGADIRDPYAVLKALKWSVHPLPGAGPEDGQTDECLRVVRIRYQGSNQCIYKAVAHECGHVILLESGHRFPHCEHCADRIGRAVCLGRDGLRRRLKTESGNDIATSLSWLFLPAEVSQRIYEVRAADVQRHG